MLLHLQSSSLLIIPLIFVFSPLINTQPSLCTADYRFHNCSQQLDCGGVNGINYPFWGVNRANYCGEPSYHVDCKNNVPKIRMMSNTLRILQINNEEKILKVARDDLWDNICPTHFSNTSVDFKRFSYAPGQKNLTIYYDCISPSDPDESYPYLPQPECVINETRINVFYMPWYVRDDPPGISCNSSVIVPFIETNTQGIQGNNLRKTLDKGFNLEWNLSDDQCETCVESGGFCGYNSSMENRFVCFCRDQPYRTSCPFRPGSTTSRSRILIPLGATVAVITTIVCICLIVQRRKFNLYKITFFFGKQSVQDQKVEAFVRSYGFLGPQRYSYYDVKKMTNVFSNKLGQGGFGDVYKGVLPDGRLVAVKLLKESKGDGEEFINEVASISRTSHVNIVTFLGFCFEEKKRALVYEFMPNGSLDKYIYDHESSTCTNQLGWNRIFQIGVGIARGLEYLHRGCNTRIVHFDIKPHNILLDEDFCPKISDFGLSKLCKSKESIISMLGGRGTPGYIAPEVFNRNFGKVSHKSDVYSYGMMIIEMVGGRRNMEVRGSQESEIYFADWIYRYTEPGNEIHGVINEEEKELAKKMILVSLWSIQAFPSDRPSISKVVEMLEGSLEDLQIPPKPSLSSPPRSIRHSSSTLVSESLVSALVIEKDPLTN